MYKQFSHMIPNLLSVIVSLAVTCSMQIPHALPSLLHHRKYTHHTHHRAPDHRQYTHTSQNSRPQTCSIHAVTMEVAMSKLVSTPDPNQPQHGTLLVLCAHDTGSVLCCLQRLLFSTSLESGYWVTPGRKMTLTLTLRMASRSERNYLH